MAQSSGGCAVVWGFTHACPSAGCRTSPPATPSLPLAAAARREAPAIVFIDEIDAVAKGRDMRLRSVGEPGSWAAGQLGSGSGGGCALPSPHFAIRYFARNDGRETTSLASIPLLSPALLLLQAMRGP
jgi:hypothetical protein